MTSWWVRWRLKSPASRLFTQPFIQEADQRKHQSSASLAFVRGIHRGPANSPHKGPVTRKMSPFYDVIMNWSFPCMDIPIITSFPPTVTKSWFVTMINVFQQKVGQCLAILVANASHILAHIRRYGSRSCRRESCRPGMGVTKAPFVNFSVSKIFELAKIPVRFLEWYSYLAGVTAAELQHLPNINVTLKR